MVFREGMNRGCELGRLALGGIGIVRLRYSKLSILTDHRLLNII